MGRKRGRGGGGEGGGGESKYGLEFIWTVHYVITSRTSCPGLTRDRCRLCAAFSIHTYVHSGPEAASMQRCGRRPILKGGWGSSPRKFWEFRWQILHSGRLPVQNHPSKLLLPGFGRSTWTDFLGSWYGHGRTGRTSGAGPDTVYVHIHMSEGFWFHLLKNK